MFSPATLAFVLMDPPFAFRKEILFFALLAATLLELSQPKWVPSGSASIGVLSVLLTLGCAVCILAHEALIVFFPYLFAALWIGFRDLRRAVRCFAAPALVSVALLILVSHFAGNAATSQTVCRSVGGVLTDPPNGLCGGAIQYLGRNSAYAHGEVLRLAQAGDYAVRIPWLIVLALLPVGMGIRALWRKRRPEARALLTTGLLSWLFSGLIFYYGTDWTRWIFIHTLSLCLLLLWVESRSGSEAAEKRGWDRKGLPRFVAIVFLLVYCLGWELTVFRQPLPFGGFLRFVKHNLLNTTAQTKRAEQP